MTEFHNREEALKKVEELVAAGALVFVSDSGGKDSQAMVEEVLRHVPAEQVRLIHATLGEHEWGGVIDHIKATRHGLPLTVVEAAYGFWEMVLRAKIRLEHQGRYETSNPYPDSKYRLCTKTLKTAAIDVEVRKQLREHFCTDECKTKRYCSCGSYKPVINAIGLRAGESSGRAKKPVLSKDSKDSVAGRDWWDWLPVHHFKCRTDRGFDPTTDHDDVFGIIGESGESAHWAYGAGMTRVSCVVCIMSSPEDLATSSVENPEMWAKYVAMEEYTGKTMHVSRVPLEELAGVKADRELVEAAKVEFAALEADIRTRYTPKDRKADAEEKVEADDSGFCSGPAPKPAAPTVVSLGSTRMAKRAAAAKAAPAPKATSGKLNEKEAAVMAALAEGGSWGLGELAERCFPNAPVADPTSWVRNSLRKLRRMGLAESAGRGIYRATAAASKAA